MMPTDRQFRMRLKMILIVKFLSQESSSHPFIIIEKLFVEHFVSYNPNPDLYGSFPSSKFSTKTAKCVKYKMKKESIFDSVLLQPVRSLFYA